MSENLADQRDDPEPVARRVRRHLAIKGDKPQLRVVLSHRV